MSAEEIRKLAVANAMRIEEQARARMEELFERTPQPVPHLEPPGQVAEVIDRLHMLRDGISFELDRLEATLGAERRL